MWRHNQNGFYYFGKISLGTRNKAEARLREKEIKRLCWAKRHGLLIHKNGNTHVPTFRELTDEYYHYKQQTRRRPEDLLTVFKAGKELNPKPINKITRSDIDLAYRNKSESARASYYQELRVFFNWIIERGYISSNPVPRLKVQNRTLIISSREYERLKESITDPDFLSLVEFAYESGCRQSECINPIIWEENRIIVNGKTGARSIPYLNPLHDLSRFKGRQWQYHRSTVAHYFKRYIRQAGLSEDYCFETLRHTFGTRLADLVGIYKTALYMGHKNIKTTQKYLHLKLF